MSAVYEWVRNLVCFYLFFTAVLHLLPKNNMLKYVRFFGGLLLAVMLLTPVLELIYHKDLLREKISFETFAQNLDELKFDTAMLDQVQRQAYIASYEKAVEQDVMGLAGDAGFVVREVKISLNKDDTLAFIKLIVSADSDRREQSGIHIDKIQIQNSQGDSKLGALRKQISDSYYIEDSQIAIILQ